MLTYLASSNPTLGLEEEGYVCTNIPYSKKKNVADSFTVTLPQREKETAKSLYTTA